MAKKIEIVGAGLAGLVAGINLARQGFRVSIHEGRDYMGGDISYADSTIMDVPAVRAELGIEVEEALEPWTITRAWAYGKKYEFGLPRGVEGFTVERGKGGGRGTGRPAVRIPPDVHAQRSRGAVPRHRQAF